MNELWIPILGVICAVGMPVLLGIIASYMTIKSKHEEKMAMIEKGIVHFQRALNRRIRCISGHGKT